MSEFRADHCPQFAAAISFHLLFSVFPLAIAAVGILGLITRDPGAFDAVARAVLKVVPLSNAGSDQLRSLLTSVSGRAGALGLLGFLGVIWSASGVMAAIRAALNVAWDTTSRRPFLRGKAVDLALVAGVFLVTGCTLGLTIIASIARQGTSHLPGALRGLTPLVGAAVSVISFVASAALLFAVFGFLYRVVPTVHTRVRGIWPGALTAAAGFEALQYGFSVYIAHFARYNKVYGSLGAIVAFLFFVYLASMVFLFGAEVASEYPRLRAEARATSDNASGSASSSAEVPGEPADEPGDEPAVPGRGVSRWVTRWRRGGRGSPPGQR